MAPKETGVLWMIIPATTAAMAGKPSPTIKGTATAAGVPKPAEPSINEPNSQAMMMTCTRRSVLISAKPSRMACIAPLCRRVLSSRMAPKMMKISVAAMISPLTLAARIRVSGTRQTSQARMKATP